MDNSIKTKKTRGYASASGGRWTSLRSGSTGNLISVRKAEDNNTGKPIRYHQSKGPGQETATSTARSGTPAQNSTIATFTARCITRP